MLAPAVAVEILVVASVEPAETFHFVFNGVRVYDVHDYGDTCLMGGVDKRL